MKKENEDTTLPGTKNPVDRLSPIVKSGPIEDAAEYEALVNSLPSDQKEFVIVATRFAKLWEYCNEHDIELPSDLAEVMSELPKLAHEERIALLERINQVLMENEHDANQGDNVRQ